MTPQLFAIDGGAEEEGEGGGESLHPPRVAPAGAEGARKESVGGAARGALREDVGGGRRAASGERACPLGQRPAASRRMVRRASK